MITMLHPGRVLGQPPTRPGGPPDEDWRDRALCAEVDAELFFPERGAPSAAAKSVCARCEVRTECLEYALAADERFGVWGGLSERQRRNLKRRNGTTREG